MRRNKKGGLAVFLLIIYTLFSSLSVTASATEAALEKTDSVSALSEDVVVGSRLYELFFGKESKKQAELTLIPGGEVFGIRMKQKHVSVVESKKIPLLRRGDLILSINGEEVSDAAHAADLIRKSGGESVTIRAIHGGEEIKIEVRPTLEDGEYRLGLSLRDGALGIGTVTFVDPETGLFGGLGHGICDGDSGDIVAMESGDITGVILGGVHRGECGKPGELTGILTDEDLGDLTKNCECGGSRS